MKFPLTVLSLAALLQYASTVQYPPKMTKMPPKEAAFNVGESIKLECEATGSPAPTFIWKRNEMEFNWTKNSGRYKKYPGAGTLVFISPGKDDEGIYQCLAKNDLGIAASVKTVLCLAELYDFTNEPEVTVEKTVGDKLSFECKALSSYPEATIIWYKIPDANKTIMTLTMSNRININPVTGALLFANVLLEDGNSVYKCGVRNDIVRRTVEGRRFRLTVRSNVRSKVIYPAAQMFVQKPSVQEGLVNKTLDLFCFFSGYPTPLIEWKKDAKKITTGEELSRMQLLDSGARLQLVDITKEVHVGNYTCTGTNAKYNGSSASDIFLVKVYSEPYWKTMPTDVLVLEGGNHTFTCEAANADGDPKWFINGEPASRYTNRSTPVGNEFSFINLTLRDSLVVQCNCSNKYGYIYQNAYLNVLRELPTVSTAALETTAAQEKTRKATQGSRTTAPAVATTTKSGAIILPHEHLVAASLLALFKLLI